MSEIIGYLALVVVVILALIYPSSDPTDPNWRW